MRRGTFRVKNTDAYTEWGLTLAEDSYKSIFSAPSLKKFDTTEWRELDGVEPDLYDPRFEPLKITLTINTAKPDKVEDFLEFLNRENYCKFAFSEIGVEMNLRPMARDSFKYLRTLGSFQITAYLDQWRREGVSFFEPSLTGKDIFTPWQWQQPEYRFGDETLSSLGFAVLEGTEANLRKKRDFRERNKASQTDMEGVVYEPGRSERATHLPHRYKAYDADILLHTQDADPRLVYQRIHDLADRLNQTFDRYGKIKNAITSLFSNTEYDFYYKALTATKVRYGRFGWWLDATLKVTINTQTQIKDILYLITEGGDLLLTQDNKRITTIKEE